MQAFHNDPEIKKKYLQRVIAHRKADEIIQGTYWERGKGCAVGCTIHGDQHANYETELGIPEWLAYLEDKIFEGLDAPTAKWWPESFLDAINPGADLDQIKGPFLIFVLESVLDKFDHAQFPDVKKSIDDVIALWKRPDATSAEFDAAVAWAAAAAAAAWAVAAVAAAAAEAAAAAAAAEAAAAWAAEAAAVAAAGAAEAAAAWAAEAAAAAAEAAEYKKFADKLLELMRGCK